MCPRRDMIAVFIIENARSQQQSKKNHGVCLQILNKTTMYLSKDSQYASRDSNRAPFEYQSEALKLGSRFSVTLCCISHLSHRIHEQRRRLNSFDTGQGTVSVFGNEVTNLRILRTQKMSGQRNNCARGRFVDRWPRFDNNST